MDPELGALEGTDLLEDLRMLREATELSLREDQVAVGNNLKNTATATDQFRLDAELIIDCSRQTGSRGTIVSFGAVFDGDSHSPLHWCVAARWNEHTAISA